MTIDLPNASDWHVNYIEQMLWYDKFRTSLDALKAVNRVIYFPKFSQPTQAEWEAAYTRQTGLVPPIIPGSKLAWMDLKSGIIKQFTTTFDLNNGELSSGTVYPMINRDYDQGSLRLIGTWKTRGEWVSPNVNAPYYAFPIDIPYLVSKGLVALWVFFRIRTVAAAPTFWIDLRGFATSWQDGFMARQEASFNERDGVGVTPATNTSYAAMAPGNPGVPLSSLQPVTPANAAVHGMLMIYNPVPTLYNGNTQEALTPTNAQLTAVGTAASVAANTLKLYQATMSKIDTWLTRPSVTFNYGVGTGQSPEPASRAWAYGLFQEPVGEMEIYL